MRSSGRGMILKGLEKLMARIVSLRTELEQVQVQRDAVERRHDILREAMKRIAVIDLDRVMDNYQEVATMEAMSQIAWQALNATEEG